MLSITFALGPSSGSCAGMAPTAPEEKDKKKKATSDGKAKDGKESKEKKPSKDKDPKDKKEKSSSRDKDGSKSKDSKSKSSSKGECRPPLSTCQHGLMLPVTCMKELKHNYSQSTPQTMSARPP